VRRQSEETASLASLASFTSTTSEDDLLRQEALRRPSWVSIRLPTLASSASSRTNSTASTITSGRSPQLGGDGPAARSPPASPRFDSEPSSSFEARREGLPQAHHTASVPPPTNRAKSSPVLPMSASFARASGRRPAPPPITTTAPSPDEPLRSPPDLRGNDDDDDNDDVPPPVPSKLGLPSERTLTNISELGRSASLSSTSSTLPALPARSPLRARRGTPGGSPTASGDSSTPLTASGGEEDGSSPDGGGAGRASPVDSAAAAGEFGETANGVDVSTVRPRRVSRHRPKTADDALPSSTSARWSTTPPASSRASHWSASDEGAVRLDDDGAEGDRPRMSRSRPLSTSSRSSGSLVGGVRDPQMRKKREARVRLVRPWQNVCWLALTR